MGIHPKLLVVRLPSLPSQIVGIAVGLGMTPIFRSSVDGSPDRRRGWRKDEHHDDSSKEVP